MGAVAGPWPQACEHPGPTDRIAPPPTPEASFPMAVTVSLVFLFGLVLLFLLRSKTLSYAAAFVAVGFGFFLASTGAAGPINQLTAAVIDAVRTM